MAIELKSFNQILGEMVRKVVAETPLNDINPGSVLLTLLEACAANDFENNTAVLNVLELLNVDAVRNNDLDAKAADYGLKRRVAIRSSGLVLIKNSNIVKQSTGLYVIKPAPIAGQNILYVNSTDGWASNGFLYVGRGTNSFEGPIPYSSIVEYPTYSQINLSSALQKDHLISDSVVNSQGEPDRRILAGTVVKIPANNQNPEVLFSTLRDAVIPAGEDKVDNVEVVALQAGSMGNAQINTITQFETLPFDGAEVTNTSSFSDGKDIETDNELRNRVKSYSITLARGTAPAIIASVIGTSDPDDSKQLASAVLTEPVKVGDPSILYIDDGSGFQPSYTGQSVDTLISNANGSEEFLQLSNYPVPRPQAINAAVGPFEIIDGSFFRVEVDGQEETIYFDRTQFLNISAATVAETIIAINNQSVQFKARFANQSNNILLYPVAHDAETIKVSVARSTDNARLYANSVLKFPTTEFSYISLYKNSARLREKETSASLETAPFASWNITSSGSISISVDATPSQDRVFALSDFAGAQSFNSISLEDWVNVFNSKFAGLTAIATPSQTIKITSNKSGASSSILVDGGTYLEKWFPDSVTSSTGKTAQFQLNRQNGNVRILETIELGDTISAGAADTKGFAVSSITTSGNYNVSTDSNGRPAEMVVVVDSSECVQRSVSLLIGGKISVTAGTGTGVMRLTSDTIDTFAAAMPGDFIYIASRTTGWLQSANTGLFQISAKGPHSTANVDSYIEAKNPDFIVESNITALDSLDIKIFSTDGLCQIWRGSYVTNPPVAPITEVVASINSSLAGIRASVFRSNSIKITSTTETGGSIAIPVSAGNCSSLFQETKSAQLGNPAHIANKVSERSLISTFKRSTPTDDNVWLNRHTYTDVKGALSIASNPDVPPFTGVYSEELTSSGVLTSSDVNYRDLIKITDGGNKGQIRSVKAILAGDTVGTQPALARTELKYSVGEKFSILEPMGISSEDSIVVVMDGDAANKTIDIRMARTGIINTGSDGDSFTPTSTEFSANDYDNETGIDFSNLTVWGKIQNSTEFADYAVWMRARNWYASGGSASSSGKMVVRSAQFGPNGNNLKFSIEYPSSPDQDSTLLQNNSPSSTKYSYVFGSGPARPTAVASGDTVAVSGPYPDTTTNFPNGVASTGNYYDYTFSSGNFASVTAGDVISIGETSGVGFSNRGQFKLFNKSGLVLRLFNPDASVTAGGVPESTSVQTAADVTGTPTIYNVATIADMAGSLHQKYFTVHDTAGSVAVWLDVDNTGVPAPPHGADRAIRIATIISNDSAATVASKIAVELALDNAFSISLIGSQITVTNTQNGSLTSATAGTSGFSVSTIAGANDVSVNGKYFIINDDEGDVAIWYDVGSIGTQEPFHGARRSIKVNTVNKGDSANTIAAATAAAINSDLKFSASSSLDIISILREFDGNTAGSSAGTSGFSVTDIDGTLGTAEIIANPGAVNIFPISGTTVSEICGKINSGTIMIAAAIGSATAEISTSTKEDVYLYSNNSTSLAYGHNPNSSSARDHVQLYDGLNYIKNFSNLNPNFTLKLPMTLEGVNAIYSTSTAPNSDIAEVGEVFKLIPTTVNNIHHHLTQKALSQLPIVADISVADDRQNVQISSKNLGSSGSIEIIGGNANKSQAYVLTESETVNDSTGEYLLVKVPAYPDTFNVGDTVTLQNDAGVRRISRLISTDTVDVINPSSGVIEYTLNEKNISAESTTIFSITDVSSLYGRPAGIVWRWEHDGTASLSQVREGDTLLAFGSLISWSWKNRAHAAGDATNPGFPIIAVNDSENWMDVVNPRGEAMTAAYGTGNLVVCPSYSIRWHLKHSAPVKVSAISRSGATVTVNCEGSHLLDDGDSVFISDSNNLADGTYMSISVASQNQFTFTSVGSAFIEGSVGATAIRSGATQTRYKIERLNINGLTRISRHDGDSPRFIDCGVAVDDYIVLGGSSFKSNNNGRYRVLAVDNDSIIFENTTATDETVYTKSFNAKSLFPTWAANTNVVTGIAGTFKYVSVGDWIKKKEDTDSMYRQVVSMSNVNPALTTQVTLGANYSGSSGVAEGIAYNMMTGYDTGISLDSVDDVIVIEGDSALAGDTVSIQNIVNNNWFSTNNSGSFEIGQIGHRPDDYRPFIRIANSLGSAQSNVLMSIRPDGLYVTENLQNKFSSLRKIDHIVLDDLDNKRRSIYLTPSNRSYKFSSENNTSITHMGKLGYSTEITTGIDGYLYYTGLLRRAQRIVDGYEPDSENFPGRRAVGGVIEILPPLIKRLNISVNVTTDEGVNLGDISSNIKSVIINYISSLGVGEDVIVSEIIASVMQIKGVGAVTFTNPIPSTERITISSNEKATIVPDDIGIA